jgi:cell wall-associated NlpC family hydrolase
MHRTPGLSPTEFSAATPSQNRRQRSKRRHVVAAILGVAAAAGGFAETVSAAGGPRPSLRAERISGDPQSPQVARLAAVAVEAKRERDRNPTAETERAYNVALSDVAAATARELGVSRLSLEYAWQRADSEHQTAVLTALTQLGVQYRSLASEPFVGFDCSGLTSFAWSQAGRQLSRASGAQISEAAERTEDTAMAGDLVQYPGHVMLYLGIPRAVVHSSNPEHDVEIWMLGDRSVNFADPGDLPAVVVAPVDVTPASPTVVPARPVTAVAFGGARGHHAI